MRWSFGSPEVSFLFLVFFFPRHLDPLSDIINNFAIVAPFLPLILSNESPVHGSHFSVLPINFPPFLQKLQLCKVTSLFFPLILPYFSLFLSVFARSPRARERCNKEKT